MERREKRFICTVGARRTLRKNLTGESDLLQVIRSINFYTFRVSCIACYAHRDFFYVIYLFFLYILFLSLKVLVARLRKVIAKIM